MEYHLLPHKEADARLNALLATLPMDKAKAVVAEFEALRTAQEQRVADAHITAGLAFKHRDLMIQERDFYQQRAVAAEERADVTERLLKRNMVSVMMAIKAKSKRAREEVAVAGAGDAERPQQKK